MNVDPDGYLLPRDYNWNDEATLPETLRSIHQLLVHPNESHVRQQVVSSLLSRYGLDGYKQRFNQELEAYKYTSTLRDTDKVDLDRAMNDLKTEEEFIPNTAEPIFARILAEGMGDGMGGVNALNEMVILVVKQLGGELYVAASFPDVYCLTHALLPHY